MSGGEGGEKTEKPTPKRLKDARRKGDVAKSKDLTDTAILFAACCGLALFGAPATGLMAALTDQSLQIGSQAFDARLGEMLARAGTVLVLLLAAGVALPFLVGIMSELVQTGLLFSPAKLSLKLSNLNPIEGAKRLFSFKNLLETLKSILKSVAVFLILYNVIHKHAYSLASRDIEYRHHAAILYAIVIESLSLTVGMFCIVSAADYIYQRFSFQKKLRMSIKDIRDETKNSEGDPLIKSSRRQMHQEISHSQARAASRSATVLIANPVHYAVALEYDPARHPAPVMTARGAGKLALVMREEAAAANVPVLVKPPLARALFHQADIAEVIPDRFFLAIAEVIAWANRIRARAADPPSPVDARP